MTQLHKSHYWFDRRNLGNLLVPVTWQAFVLIGIQAVIVAVAVMVIIVGDSAWPMVGWLAICAFAMLLTFVVAIGKSPMPHWLRIGNDD